MAETPKSFQGIMLSSTFTDLKEHRQKAKFAIERLGYHAVGMESGGAQTADVIDVSFGYVRDSAAYVGIITHRYGQTPHDPLRNPDERSITELEFDEAVKLDRPILLFIMADDHPSLPADIEHDPARRARLQSFKDRAKLMRGDGRVERVYETFRSLEDFAERVGPAIGNLARELERAGRDPAATTASWSPEPMRAEAPALRALPPYIASHDVFIGRDAELGVLDDWASAADPHPIMLFEAMGGAGKSMLTWHWLTRRAAALRTDWAGCFWYSFYEQGATLAGFCREALSYITGRPGRDFAAMRTAELGERLIAELDRRPWLLVLDGMERILVGYQRSDAAQLRDEDVDAIRDPLASRDPCMAIRPDDDELLRRLTAVTRSKLLASTRLTPARLVNKSGQAIARVKRELLKGLRPGDAESLFRACGIRGDSAGIQAFLQTNCDGHPLVIGVLAGLVTDYLPDRGNFDRWRDDPAYGGKLDWSELDLVQSRNHILDTAIATLDPMSLQLLHGLALLIGGADYALLEAINPHLSPGPERPKPPEQPELAPTWAFRSETSRERAQTEYRTRHDAYLAACRIFDDWRASPDVRAAARRLNDSVRNLERRGLLQYDQPGRRFDLHPVVRGVVAARMSGEERATSGGRVVDYCRAASPREWDHAETLEEVALGRQLVATLTGMGRFDEALSVYRGSLSTTLIFRLEAYAEDAAIIKEFFPAGWTDWPRVDDAGDRAWLLASASAAMVRVDEKIARDLTERALVLSFERVSSFAYVSNLAAFYGLAGKARIFELAAMVARAQHSVQDTFVADQDLLVIRSILGDKEEADRLWLELSEQPRPLFGPTYRPGDVEACHAFHCYRYGLLTEAVLADAERTAAGARNRVCVRNLARLRGFWLIDEGHAGSAVESLGRAVAMARAVSAADLESEAALALARLQTGDREAAHAEAERLDIYSGTVAFYIAQVWDGLGERDRAVAAALRAHAAAVDDGEPYVFRHELDRARALLERLGADAPDVPRHDPATLPPFDWEPALKALIARADAERAELHARWGQDTI